MPAGLSPRLAAVLAALPLRPDSRVLEIACGPGAVLLAGDEPFDPAVAIRVGALDGRHPEAGRRVLQRLGTATAPGARLFVDGGDPLRELPIPRG